MSHAAGSSQGDTSSLVDSQAALSAAHEWRRIFPGEERQLGMVRRWLATLLPECPARDDVTVVVTELATNAVQHTASGRGGWFAVDVALSQRVVRVCVSDRGAREGPRIVADPADEHGRGLLVVRGLSERIGVSGDHRGRQVWADIQWEDTSATESLPSPHAAIQNVQAGLVSHCPAPHCNSRRHHPGPDPERKRDGMTGSGWPGGLASPAPPTMRHDVPRQIRMPARPDITPAAPGSYAVMMTPGRALIALRAELAGWGVAVSGMVITRLHGMMPLAGGPVVRYCCGWLAWSAGRPSHRGRALQTLHSAHDPAGAARRLMQSSGTDPDKLARGAGKKLS